MFKKNIDYAFRNIRKNWNTSILSVLGMMIGLSASITVFQVVKHQYNYDKFELGRDRIYRVVSEVSINRSKYAISGVPVPMGNMVKKETPGIELPVTMQEWLGEPIQTTIYRGRHLKTQKQKGEIIFTTAEYFSLVPYTWVAGSPQKLSEPNCIVLTDEKAKLIFNSNRFSDLIDQQITFDDSIHLRVVGIVKKLESPSDFTFSEFISKATIQSAHLTVYFEDSWKNINGGSSLIIRLSPNVLAKDVEKNILTAYFRNSPVEKDDPNYSVRFHLQPLEEIHFSQDYRSFQSEGISYSTIHSMIVLALILLFLGCVNFVNIQTANSSKQAKEIGVRKILGASRLQLKMQFFTQSMLLTIISVGLGICFIPLIFSLLKQFLPLNIPSYSWFELSNFLFVLILIISISFLAGFYPALTLSDFVLLL